MDWINSVRTPTRGKMRVQKTSRKPLKKKKNYRMREDICKRCNQQEINFKNIQTAHTAQRQKNKQPNQQNGQKT